MGRARKPRPTDEELNRPNVGRIFTRKVVTLPLNKWSVNGRIFYSQSEALAYAQTLQDHD